MPKAGTGAGSNGAPGSQTLARGLSALQLVAAAPNGLTAQQVADDIGVHRTIAYRLLSTLAQYRFVVKGEDGRYRSAAALAVLGASFDNNVRQLCVPTLRALADELGTTVSLLIAEGDQQVAIAVIVPTNVFYQLSFHEGSRYPLDRGAAGIALLATVVVLLASCSKDHNPPNPQGGGGHPDPEVDKIVISAAGDSASIVDKLNQAIVKIASNPEFQKRHMFNRGLTPVLDSPEHFAKTIEIEAPLGRDVVKASGLYPDVK